MINFYALANDAIQPLYEARAIIFCILWLKITYLIWKKFLNQEERDLIKAWLRLPF